MLIERTVGDVLVTHLGIDPALLVADASLVGDIGLDSLALTEALLVLEDELAICLPDPLQDELRTFGDLVAVVASQVGAGPSRRRAAG